MEVDAAPIPHWGYVISEDNKCVCLNEMGEVQSCDLERESMAEVVPAFREQHGPGNLPAMVWAARSP